MFLLFRIAFLPAIYGSLEVRAKHCEQVSKKSCWAFRHGVSKKSESAQNDTSVYRPKGVFGKGVGNSQKCVRNASKMRQSGACFIGKRGTFQNASKLCQKCISKKCAEHLWGRTPFRRCRMSLFGDFSGTFRPFWEFLRLLAGRPRKTFSQFSALKGLETPVGGQQEHKFCSHFSGV